MTVELVIAGLCCFLLVLGHAAIGLRWVLPHLSARSLPATPFGSSRLTLGMLVFTWDVVTVMLVALGVLAMTLSGGPR